MLLMLIITFCAGYVALMSSRVQTLIVQSITDDLSQKLGTQISIRKVDFRFFNKFVLKDFLIRDQRNDTLVFSQALVVGVDSLSFNEQKVYSNNISLEKAYINSICYKDSSNYNYMFLVDSLGSSTPSENKSPWQFTLNHVGISEARIKNNNQNVSEKEGQFDYNHIDLKDILIDFYTEKKDSTLLFRLDHFSMKEQHSLEIKNISGEMKRDAQNIYIKDFHIKTGFSDLKMDSCFMKLRNDSTEIDINKRPFILQLAPSSVSLKEVAYFVPELQGMEEKVSIKGKIKGPISNLKIKDLGVRLRKNTMLSGNLSFMGLPNIKNTFIFAKLDRAVVDLQEVRKIKMPLSFGEEYLQLPASIENQHKLYYKGEFTGFPSDFVCFGTMSGALGQIDTDIAIRPDNNGRINVSGAFNTTNFKLGGMINSKSINQLTLRSNIQGYYTENGKYDMKVIGTIGEIQLKDYIIHSIYLNGQAYTGGFSGGIRIEDPNLNLNFDGKADYLADIPNYDFNLDVENFVPAFLKIGEPSRIDTLNINVDAKFSGNSIDNFKGGIDIHKFNIKNGKKSCELDKIELNTNIDEGERSFKLKSKYIDLGIVGNYTYKSLYQSVNNIVSSHLPSLSSVSVLTDNNRIKINGTITNDHGLLEYFSEKTAVRFPITISGSLTDSTHTADLFIDVPELYHEHNLIKHLTLSIQDKHNALDSRLRASKVSIGENYTLHNLAMHTSAENDTIATLLSWSNADSLTFSGNLPITTIISRDNEEKKIPKIEFKVAPSYIYIADHPILIGESTVKIDSSHVDIDNLKISNLKHSINIEGEISEQENDSLNIHFKDVSIGKIDTICNWDTGLSGITNGVLTIKDIYKNKMLLGDLFIKDFSFSDKPLGDISLKSDWNSIQKVLTSQLLLWNGEKKIIYAHGDFSPSKNTLNYDAELDRLPFVSLMPFLNDFSYHLDGFISGKVKVEGPATHPFLVGNVKLDKGEIGIDFTKTTYAITDSVSFVPDTIVFNDITLKDKEGNIGKFNGYIKHEFFSNFDFDLNIGTQYLSVLNTTIDDNEDFYGKAHGSGDVRLTGNTDDLKLNVNMRTELGTDIAIPMEGPSTATENNFIRFKKPKRFFKEEVVLKQGEEDEFFTFNLDLTMTPDAKCRIIFDRSSSDLIEGRGNGDLHILYDKEGDLSIYGDYTIAQGNYNFNRQGFISKHFKVKEGGRLTWEGDPYKANLDLEAVYSTKASLQELLGESNNNDYSKRIKVDCIIKLSNNLMNPKVNFAINLPTADERTKDEIAQYLSTEEEVTRQMISILLIGKFTTPDYLKANNTQENNADILSATASELLSNQFSSWLSQISNDFDIGFNYRPGDNVSDRQIEVALSTQLLNNRVIINGNIGNNGSLQSKNTNEIVGEVEVYVKLTKNGKLQLKVYNRSNDELLYDTAPYTQGVGISFKENFNSFNELFERYRKQRAKRKDKKEKRRLQRKEKRRSDTSQKTKGQKNTEKE